MVRPGTHPPQLTTLARRAELAQELGIDVFCVMPFTPALASRSPKDFAHGVLVETLHAAEVVVGDNFTFGHKAAGDVAKLREFGKRFGFEVQAISCSASTRSPSRRPTSAPASPPVMSVRPPKRWAVPTASRASWSAAMVADASWGFRQPTWHRRCTPRSPADGVYACWFTVIGPGATVGQVEHGKRYQAAVSVGTNPTFSGRARTVEAFVLDAKADLYGQYVAVDFVERIRPMERFDSIDGLVKAIADDVDRSRAILARDAQA